MIFRSIALAGALLMASAIPASAQQADDDIVRLPGQGFTKREVRKPDGTPDRLVAGGGLFLSFDMNGDGRITRTELEAGTAAAFAKADANGDGHLTAFEQIKWAESLPTRDDTLANPVRFDPNLDRRVSPEEFETVIAELAEHYVEETSDVIVIASLKAPKPKPERASHPAPPESERPSRGVPGGS
ncbi:hypothetical protein [Hyphomonas sp.]|uniref:hypothetical protein n=1 Tax=Hyphomonas sp. TaxID=87 RepID=UPI0035275F0B